MMKLLANMLIIGEDRPASDDIFFRRYQCLYDDNVKRYIENSIRLDNGSFYVHYVKITNAVIYIYAYSPYIMG